jgi:hypothetical protein
MLIPDPTPEALGVTFLLIGGQGLYRVVARLRRVRADPDPDWHRRHALWRFAIPAVGHLTALAVGGLMLRGDPAGVDWLVATVFMLVSSAAGSCWELLKEIGNRHQAARSPG